MSLRVKTKRVGAAIGVAGALASGTLLGTSPAVAAEGATQLEICSAGDFATVVILPQRDNWRSGVIPAGDCASKDIGDSDRAEWLQVYAYENSRHKFIVSGEVRPSKGGFVTTSGTFENPEATTPTV